MTTVQQGSLTGWVNEAGRAGTVHVEDVYDTDIDDLWSAVTDPARLARWVAVVEGDLRPGGTFEARFTSTAEGPGRIEICDAPHHLLLTMRPDTAEPAEIEAWLTSEGEGTRLAVEERGLPVDRAPDHAARWQAHIEDLRAHLEGRPAASWPDRWSELISSYRPDGA